MVLSLGQIVILANVRMVGALVPNCWCTGGAEVRVQEFPAIPPHYTLRPDYSSHNILGFHHRTQRQLLPLITSFYAELTVFLIYPTYQHHALKTLLHPP